VPRRFLESDFALRAIAEKNLDLGTGRHSPSPGPPLRIPGPSSEFPSVSKLPSDSSISKLNSIDLLVPVVYNQIRTTLDRIKDILCVSKMRSTCAPLGSASNTTENFSRCPKIRGLLDRHGGRSELLRRQPDCH
jgi:hypothetical protein